MKRPIVIVGIGEMGELFASGLLKSGHPVCPVLRDTALAAMAFAIPEPELVLAAVGENDLHPVLESMPNEWRGRMALLQNPRVGLANGHLEKPVPFMLRQARHERNRLILLNPFTLSLSKCEVFRGVLILRVVSALALLINRPEPSAAHPSAGTAQDARPAHRARLSISALPPVARHHCHFALAVPVW
jgi:hypothetical protein